jgi:hypothetical protein
MSTTFTEILPATKTSPNNGIRWEPASGRLEILTGRKSDAYRVAEFPADGGRGFRFTKLTPGTDRDVDAYSVFCATPGTGLHDSCECRGFLRHGQCKHLAAVRAIEENRFLWARTEAAPAVEPVAEAAPSMTPDEALVELTRILAIPTSLYRRGSFFDLANKSI